MFEGFIGLIAGGAIMYFIQPWVKDTVTKMFLGAPAVMAKAQALRDRAEKLFDVAQEKQAAANDASKGPSE